VTYYVSPAGRLRPRFFYAYRAAGVLYGQQVNELCVLVTLHEVQEEVNERARTDDLTAYADVDRLRDNGLVVPSDVYHD